QGLHDGAERAAASRHTGRRRFRGTEIEKSARDAIGPMSPYRSHRSHGNALNQCLQLKLAQRPREFAADDPAFIGMMLDAHGADEEGAREGVFAALQEDDEGGAALEAPPRQQAQAG